MTRRQGIEEGGNARRIAATADWIEPAHLWIALIGAPSAGKTPALQPMIAASRALERDAEPAWREALARYERDAEAACANDKSWREAVRAAAAEGKLPPDRPIGAEAPIGPPMPRVVTMDTSTQELQRLLSENPRGLMHVRDELAGWLGSFDQYGLEMVPIAHSIWSAGTAEPMFAIASNLIAHPSASSMHRLRSSGAWCPTNSERHLRMRMTA
jgi:hypothetical protein